MPRAWTARDSKIGRTRKKLQGRPEYQTAEAADQKLMVKFVYDQIRQHPIYAGERSHMQRKPDARRLTKLVIDAAITTILGPKATAGASIGALGSDSAVGDGLGGGDLGTRAIPGTGSFMAKPAPCIASHSPLLPSGRPSLSSKFYHFNSRLLPRRHGETKASYTPARQAEIEEFNERMMINLENTTDSTGEVI
ncbi:hypothetical protein WAI453_001753 [Rhynchosporium graminicola]|uniref:Uncharacterized protein n=1 Tax=Rhynchosporium graminicola TaxID=2792576 RepID=A0A1E1LPF7_9HELO|nr:uncharacterized protein RCO7_09080 [Rhynchosporium commune]